MSLREALDDALDALPGASGSVTVEADGRSAVVDVRDHDRLGVRIRALRITHEPRDVADEAARIAGHRGLPEPIVPIEVDPRLGGAVLRGEPEDHEFTELDVRPDATEVRRWRAVPGESREEAALELTRRQLGRLIDALS